MNSQQLQALNTPSVKSAGISREAVSVAARKGAAQIVYIDAERNKDVLCDRYRMGNIICVSRLGVTYRAFDLQRQLPVAIKLVPPGADKTLLPERRLQHEANVMTRLRHPNIVAVSALVRDEDGNSFMVMEGLRGRTLQQLLDAEGPLPLPRVIEILRGIVAALQYAHEHETVHGDLKPNSIFLHEEEGDEFGTEPGTVIKLFDFGLARNFGDENVDGAPNITPGKIIGTPAYLAPEALFPERSRVDARSDLWALAVLVYRMLTGRLPFFHEDPHYLCALVREREPEPIEKLMPELPTCVALALHTALAKDKWQRFGSVQDFLRALEGLPPLRDRLSMGTCRPTLHKLCPELILRCQREDGESVPESIMEDRSTRRLTLTGEMQQLIEQERQAAASQTATSMEAPPIASMPPRRNKMWAHLRNRPSLMLAIMALLATTLAGALVVHVVDDGRMKPPFGTVRVRIPSAVEDSSRPDISWQPVAAAPQPVPAVWQPFALEPLPGAWTSTTADTASASASANCANSAPRNDASARDDAANNRSAKIAKPVAMAVAMPVAKPVVRKDTPVPPLRDASTSLPRSSQSQSQDSFEINPVY